MDYRFTGSFSIVYNQILPRISCNFFMKYKKRRVLLFGFRCSICLNHHFAPKVFDVHAVEG